MTYNHVFPNSQSLTPKNQRGSKVSIITRTKNRPILLVRAIYSVLAQTYHDWELIIINDGGDRAEIETLLTRFSSVLVGRMHLLHHDTSKGMEAASNAGLQLASGDFIVIHDDDDAWYPNFLENSVKYLNQPGHQDYAAVASNCTVIFEKIEGNTVIETRREIWSSWKEHVDYKDLLNNNLFPPICLLIRKPVVDHLSGFNENLPVLGDWDFMLRLIQIGDIGTINQPLAYYYHREPTSHRDAYGNSVLAGRSLHQEYNVKYRNSLMRAYEEKNPAAIGGLMTLIADLDAREKRIQAKIDQLERVIGEQSRATLGHHHELLHATQAYHHELLRITHDHHEILRAAQGINTLIRIPRAIWRRIYGLRRIIARLRGRI